MKHSFEGFLCSSVSSLWCMQLMFLFTGVVLMAGEIDTTVLVSGQTVSVPIS